jgi:hypothetical protein
MQEALGCTAAACTGDVIFYLEVASHSALLLLLLLLLLCRQVDQIIPPESPLVKLLEWLMERLQPGAVLQPQLPIPGMPRG